MSILPPYHVTNLSDLKTAPPFRAVLPQDAAIQFLNEHMGQCISCRRVECTTREIDDLEFACTGWKCIELFSEGVLNHEQE